MKKQRPNINFPTPPVDELPEELQRMYDLTEKLTEEAAAEVAAKVDAEITAAIQMRIGTNWAPNDMSGRLHRTIYLDGSEVMILDGVPFMHIGPWKWSRELYGKLTATREITHLKGTVDGLPN